MLVASNVETLCNELPERHRADSGHLLTERHNSMSDMKLTLPDGTQITFGDYMARGGKKVSEQQDNLNDELEKGKAEKGGSKSKLVKKMKDSVPTSRLKDDKASSQKSSRERLGVFLEGKLRKNGQDK